MSQMKLPCAVVLMLTQITVVQPTGCPDEYVDTGQTDLPAVVWNGERVSGGDTLAYCPTQNRCMLNFTATSKQTPDLYIGGRCYAIDDMKGRFNATVHEGQHPNYAFSVDCDRISNIRFVYSLTEYSKEYKLERSSVHCNGTPSTEATGGTTNNPPSGPRATTTSPGPGGQGAVPHDGIAIGVTVAAIGLLAVAVLTPVIIVIVVLCRRRRRKRRRNSHTDTPPSNPPMPAGQGHVTNDLGVNDLGAVDSILTVTVDFHQESMSNLSGGGDTSSSISVVAGGNSMRRGVGDGMEERTHPFPVIAMNENGNNEMVTGQKSAKQNVPPSNESAV